MEPVTSTISIILGSAKVVKAIHDFAGDETKSLAKEATGTGLKSLLHRLKPTDREKAAKQAVKNFAEAWYRELEDTTPLTSALPGYHDQLENLLTAAAAEIAEWMDPDTKEVDLGAVERIWSGVKKSDLPEDFDWKQVARNYTRAIKRQFRDDPAIRGAYETALHERNTEAAERTAAAVERLAGPSRGFDLAAYRKFLVEKKCSTLQLATLHFSTYTVDRKVSIWNVFVPQSARESAPILGLPPEVLRRMREEGYLTQSEDETPEADLLRRYQSSPLRPILEILDPELNKQRHVVVTGDPGAGKSALLKYLCLRWANELKEPVPILIDLKEYGKKQEGFLKFCQSGLTLPRFDALDLDKHLKAGTAALYLDGLDEIFVHSTRHSVVEEIATISAEYPQAQIVVTSRKVGYQPERLTSAGFVHATLEDFDQIQIKEFLDRWHMVAEDDEARRSRLSERLTSAISDTTSIRELAGNPLLLTMMAILNRSQELPRNRASLYLKASEVLLHDWDADRALHSTDKFDRDDKEKLLRDLAGEMQQAKGGLAGNLIERPRLVKRFRESLDQLGIQDSHTSALALVQQLEERNFILASVGAGRFSFVHRTFLEYFCAAWFVERLGHKEGSELYLSFEQLRDGVFGQHWREEKWNEVLRLITGMVHETKADELIQFLMNQDGTNDQLANLMLAAGCLYDVRNRKAIQSTDEELWNRLTIEASRPDPTDRYVSYRLAESDTRRIAVRWIASTWRSEKAREWLKEAANVGPSTVIQCSGIEEFARGWKDDPGTLSWLKDRAFSEQLGEGGSKAAEEIVRGWREQSEIVPWLKALAREAKNEYSRRAAVLSLAQYWTAEPEVFPLVLDRLRNDNDWYVRSGAVLALVGSWPANEELLSLLLERFWEEKDELAQRRIIASLGWKWQDDPNVILLLKDRARNDISGGPQGGH